MPRIDRRRNRNHRAPSWASRDSSRFGFYDNNASGPAREQHRRDSRERSQAYGTSSRSERRRSRSQSADVRALRTWRNHETEWRRSFIPDWQSRRISGSNELPLPRQVETLPWNPWHRPNNHSHDRPYFSVPARRLDYSKFGTIQEEAAKVLPTRQTGRRPPPSIPRQATDIHVPGSHSALANRIDGMPLQPSASNGNVPGQFQHPTVHQGHSKAIKREPDDDANSGNIQSPILSASDLLDLSQFIKLEPPDEESPAW
ncbi:hypothetical protein F4801DRAFT_182510 [Xylaria longipes]|nr:hypothetical protein F4801DRAFT_182510 [Xylaria longipes]